MYRFLFLAIGISIFMPIAIEAQDADMAVQITSEKNTAKKWIHLTPIKSTADVLVKVTGECPTKGNNLIYLTPLKNAADEWWYVTKNSSEAEKTICLSGDVDIWFSYTR